MRTLTWPLGTGRNFAGVLDLDERKNSMSIKQVLVQPLLTSKFVMVMTMLTFVKKLVVGFQHF